MSDPGDDAARRQELSALMDGEADGEALDDACACWREEAKARCAWHDWHLIGDVLRSDDLAADPRHDAAFVAALRKRLAAEPVVVAADAPKRSVPSRRKAGVLWGAGAVAAGVMIVGTLVSMSQPPPMQAPGGDRTIARSPQSTVVPASAPPNTQPAADEPQVFVTDGRLIRDPLLYRYLTDHKSFTGVPAPAQSSFLPVSIEAPAR